MTTGKTQVTLATMGGGGLEERFRAAHAEMLADCRNPNKDKDAAREIIIKIRMKPEGDRGYVSYQYSVGTKRPAFVAGSMVAEVQDLGGGDFVALTRAKPQTDGDPRQKVLGEAPTTGTN